ncbi:hypothetical protein [Lentibacillus sp. Marseille-P4043]|uniref:hypothetical protein n=1 Tax=Lentibacillus sp. Marseille-P4043 TaxID=2040293 RepID=UPI00131A5796|nr:hypothetical protein [Lentibacillus sp. Marseille-P4043]
MYFCTIDIKCDVTNAGTSTQKQKHQPESRIINPKTKTSTRKQNHRPENENINPKTETSTRKRKHQPERENINPKAESSTPSAGTSTRKRKHQPEPAYQAKCFSVMAVQSPFQSVSYIKGHLKKIHRIVFIHIRSCPA